MTRDMIIVHHTGAPGSTIKTIRNTHINQNGWPKVGYHKVVQKDGLVFGEREDSENGIHTINHNGHTLAVCLCGDFNTQSVTPAQWASLVKVVADWCKKHSIVPGPSTIVGHRDKQPTKSLGGVTKPNTCPGENLYSKLPQLRTEVAQALPSPLSSYRLTQHGHIPP